ncbi:MAG TPA: LuxR C-terminal-related transcriptional regulator [Acidimicrobiia bacterium]|nr:LuxR C-terminal-related transcriptional regulator [Acidimicrobiia bacterium]
MTLDLGRDAARGPGDGPERWAASDPGFPVPLTRFIGRHDEIVDVAALVSRERLVTLTGAGGAGKTRLALEVARVVEASFDHAWFVDLDVVLEDARHEDVALALAEAVPAASTDGDDPTGALAAALRGVRALVVLDNCEHALDGCSRTVRELLERCPTVHVLATSREPLDIPGEALWHIRPLTMPPTDDAAAIAGCEAGELFIDRARLAHAGFTLDASSAREIREICQRVDALPLAIELAAAHVRSGSLTTIRRGLRDRFQLLARNTDATDHHASLFHAIDLSYCSLHEREQRVFRYLSVFQGPFGLDAAAAVCGCDETDLTANATIVRRLVERSLVACADQARGDRYVLQQNTRAFARHKLAEGGETDEVMARLVAWARARAIEFASRVEGPDMRTVLAEIDGELPNIGVAFARTASTSDVASMAVIVSGLVWYSILRGRLRDCDRWLTHIETQLESVEPATRLPLAWARVLVSSHRLRSIDEIERACDELAASARDAGDPWFEGRALGQLGMLRIYFQPASAGALLGEALTLCEQANDQFWMSYLRGGLAVLCQSRDRDDLAVEYLDDMARAVARLPNPQLVAFLLAHQATSDVRFGNLAQAGRRADEALLACEGITEGNFRYFATEVKATLDLLEGEASRSRAELETLRDNLMRQGDYQFVPVAQECIARVLIIEGRAAEAIGLLAPVVNHPDVRRIAAYRLRLRETIAVASMLTGEAGDARHLFEVCAEDASATGNEYRAAMAAMYLGALDRASGAFQSARGRFLDALDCFARLGYRPDVAAALTELSGLLFENGNRDAAIRLRGAADAINGRDGVRYRFARQCTFDADLEALRSSVDQARFDDLFGSGAMLTIPDAVAYAAKLGRKPVRHGPEGLTPTEQEIVRLVAQGFSNPRIASELTIGRETVKSHLSQIYRKLGVANRTELAARYTANPGP